jgi:hypothetical protein
MGMRRLIALAGVMSLVIAGTALAGAPATDSNGDFVDLSVNITPPVGGTAKAAHAVGITFDSFTGNRINANQTLSNNSLAAHFDQNFASNGLKFPACPINPTGLSTCAANTRMGSGTAEGELLSSTGGPPTYVSATLSAFNGKPFQAKNATMIIIASVGGKPTLELDFQVARAHGGLSFTEIQFPPSPGGTTGPTTYLTKFHLVVPAKTEKIKVHGKTETIGLLQAPTTCHGSWTFSETLGFASQPPLTATDSEPCFKG